MTLNEMIDRLTDIRDSHGIGDDTCCVVVSLSGSEIEPLEVEDVSVVSDTDGDTVEVRSKLPQNEDMAWAFCNLPIC